MADNQQVLKHMDPTSRSTEPVEPPTGPAAHVSAGARYTPLATAAPYASAGIQPTSHATPAPHANAGFASTGKHTLHSILAVSAALLIAAATITAQPPAAPGQGKAGGPPGAGQGKGKGPAGPVNPLLNGNPYVSPQEVKGGPITRLADGHPDIQGAWSQRTVGNTMSMYSVEKTAGHTKSAIPRTAGVIIDPEDGVLPYQPWAREKANDMSDNHMVEESDAHCFLGGVPHSMWTPFGMRIIQTPDSVVMTWEFMHAYRTIYTDGRPHIDPSIHLFEGDSRGHWEGDTLVTDVTNQVGRTWYDQSANFHSDQIHVVERITPIDSNNLKYEATITDPKVLTRPFTIQFFYSRILDKNFEHLEFACIEGEVDVKQH